MTGLERRYRLLAASFLDGGISQGLSARFGAHLTAGVDLLVLTMAHDLATPPADVDREGIRALLEDILPGRLAGTEAYISDVVDLLEEFLLHTAAEEGLTLAWEWSSAVGDHREAFATALDNPDRPAPSGGPRPTPDRRPGRKIGRNEPCFCGSGRKYKHCCYRLLE